MARPLKAWWDKRSNRYYVRLGNVSEKSGKRRNLMLCDEQGRPLAFGDHAGVRAAIARRQAEIDSETRRDTGPTVGELARAFIDWHRANGSAPRTVADHEYHLGAFCRFEFGGVPYGRRAAASIELADLTRVRKAMTEAGNGSGYIKLRYASVLACWRWACRPVEDRDPPRMLQANPFEGVRRPRRGDVKPKLLPWSASRRLLRFARARARNWYPRDRAGERLKVLALHFASLAGCRPDEAAGLRWDEIDWDERIAVLCRGKTYRNTRKARRIDLRPGLLRALRAVERWEGRHPEFVFLSADTRKVRPPGGRDLTIWFRGLRADAIAAGLELPEGVTMYWLRHDWQSLGVAVDSAERVSQAAGNSPQVLLSTYAHVQNRTIRETADKVAAARRRRKGPAG